MTIDMGVAYQADRQELACCKTRWETLGCNIWKEERLGGRNLAVTYEKKNNPHSPCPQYHNITIYDCPS